MISLKRGNVEAERIRRLKNGASGLVAEVNRVVGESDAALECLLSDGPTSFQDLILRARGRYPAEILLFLERRPKADDSVGRFVKVNEQWFQVIGVAGPQLTVQSDVAGLPAQDRNNLMYVPLYSAIFRLEDGQSQQKDEIDGIYLQMRPGSDIPSAAALLRGLLNVSHRQAGDFTIVSPAELLADLHENWATSKIGQSRTRLWRWRSEWQAQAPPPTQLWHRT